MPLDWLNDAAKGFVSPQAEFRDLDEANFTHLRVQVPTAEYIPAMKVMAARAALGGGSGDKEDIRFLVRPSRILPRSMYLVEEIFSEEAK